jgi:hypothetical protein
MVQVLTESRARRPRARSGGAPGANSGASNGNDAAPLSQTAGGRGAGKKAAHPQANGWEMTAEEALRVNFVECEL